MRKHVETTSLSAAIAALTVRIGQAALASITELRTVLDAWTFAAL